MYAFANVIYIFFVSNCSFVLYVNGDKRITDVGANDGQWHFVCVTWKSLNGTWAIYLDGNLADSGTGLAPNTTIEGWYLHVLAHVVARTCVCVCLRVYTYFCSYRFSTELPLRASDLYPSS